jgi:hypothetical protein
MSLVFRTRPEQGSTRKFAVSVLNALKDGDKVYIVGNVLDDAAYAEFVAAYATDEGTAVVRADGVAPSAFRQTVKALATTLKFPVSFFPEQAYIDDKWTIVGYRVVTATV